jgi:hypothetical protein
MQSKNNSVKVGGKSKGSMRRQKSVTITIIIITLSFILFTGLGAVVNFFINNLVNSYTGNVIIVLGDTLCFTFHGLNIVSLLVTNKRFRQEFINMILLRLGSWRIEPSRTTNTNNSVQTADSNE